MVLIKPLIFSILLFISASTVFAVNDGNGPVVGQPSPNLLGRTLDDKPYDLNRDLGRTKVINFFWISCSPCRDELPELAKLEKKFKKVKFIAVHTALYKPAEKQENVEKFIKSLRAAPTNIVLTTSKELGENFNIKAQPHTMILDENNVVLLNISGNNKANMQQLASELNRLTRY